MLFLKKWLLRIADIQSKLILALLYLVVMAPFALLLNLRSDSLRRKAIDSSEGTWIPKSKNPETLEDLQRQY